ncbi:MAG: hypothetical protein AVDCRST_MAG52-2103, partial [uncultured Blastococcus sp.]
DRSHAPGAAVPGEQGRREVPPSRGDGRGRHPPALGGAHQAHRHVPAVPRRGRLAAALRPRQPGHQLRRSPGDRRRARPLRAAGRRVVDAALHRQHPPRPAHLWRDRANGDAAAAAEDHRPHLEGDPPRAGPRLRDLPLRVRRPAAGPVRDHLPARCRRPLPPGQRPAVRQRLGRRGVERGRRGQSRAPLCTERGRSPGHRTDPGPAAPPGV